MLFEDLGDALVEHVASARSEVLLVAPFVKVGALERVLAGLHPGVDLTLVTRWRLDEIAAGVSDVDAYDSVAQRGGVVRLLDSLHAKYYRSDNLVLAGSANLTATALGWSTRPNLEMLHRWTMADPDMDFEHLFVSSSVLVDRHSADLLLSLQDDLRSQDESLSESTPEEIGTADRSIFHLFPRDPLDVWRLYSDSGGDLVAEADRSKFRLFLNRLGIPDGLSAHAQLRTAVGHALWADPEVRDLYEWIGSGKRFGEVSQRVQAAGKGRADADFLAQVIYRTVLYFLPERFEIVRPRHSEVLRQRSSDMVT